MAETFSLNQLPWQRWTSKPKPLNETNKLKEKIKTKQTEKNDEKDNENENIKAKTGHFIADIVVMQ